MLKSGNWYFPNKPYFNSFADNHLPNPVSFQQALHKTAQLTFNQVNVLCYEGVSLNSFRSKTRAKNRTYLNVCGAWNRLHIGIFIKF